MSDCGYKLLKTLWLVTVLLLLIPGIVLVILQKGDLYDLNNVMGSIGVLLILLSVLTLVTFMFFVCDCCKIRSKRCCGEDTIQYASY